MGQCRALDCMAMVDLTPLSIRSDSALRYCNGLPRHRYVWLSRQEAWIAAGVRGDEFGASFGEAVPKPGSALGVA